jgi:tetratricopeptide (TPR) repeat protein
MDTSVFSRAPLGATTECRRGTQECVRHIGSGLMRILQAIALALVCAVFAIALQNSEARRYFEQARQSFEQKKWDDAAAAAARALAADPRMGDAEILLGLIATVRSEFAQAEKHFARAAALEPRNYQAQAYLGSTYLQEKRVAEAAAAFGKVLELNPGNAAANYNLGLIALAQDAPAKALRFFEKVTLTNHGDVPALIGTLESQLMLHKTSDALETTRNLGGLLERQDPRLFQVATLLAQHGESAAAIPLMEQVRAAFPQSYDVSFNLALACFETAQYDRAAEILQTVTGPQGPAEAFDLLGTVEEKRAHAESAEHAFQEAARREAANEDYQFNYGNSLVQHGKLEAGVRAFRTAVSDLPKSWKLRVGLGSACYLAGDYRSAAEALLAAVKLKPDSAAAYFLLGEAYDSAEGFQKPIEAAFTGYLKGAPRDAWAYYHYASIQYANEQGGRDDYRAAVANLNEALHLNPNFAEAHLKLGLIALAEGKVAQGISALEKAVSLNPRIAAAHYQLGLAYQRAGNTVRAKEEMDRFRALKDDAHYRGQVLESLGSLTR